MNERIKELEKQSIFYNEEEETWEFDRKKFAELIVRECAGVAWGIYANQEIANGIKQHFGVE